MFALTMAINARDASEDDLFIAAANGDQIAFAELCVRVVPSLFQRAKALCRKLNIAADQADDLVQDTIFRAIQVLERRQPSHLSPGFLYVIMKHSAIDLLKRRRPISNQSELLQDSSDTGLSVEENAAIKEAFGILRSNDREIIQLLLIDGFSVCEAASFLKLTESAVYKRYERALQRLRKLLT